MRDLKIIQKKFNLKETKIPSFSKTRWWSLLNLIRIIIQQEVALLNLLQTYKNGFYKNLILNADDVKLLNVTVGILGPIQEISETLSGENYVTGSTLLPICIELGKTQVDSYEETEIDNDIVRLKKEMALSIFQILKDRYESDEQTSEHLHIAAFIDPRFKGTFFDSTKIKDIIQKITELSSELESIPISINRHEILGKKKSGLTSIFKSLKTIEESTPTSLNVKIKKEIDQYMNMPTTDVDGDPLVWWRHNCHVFPLLSQCARKFLSIQATSVPSERVFRKGGHIVSDLRASLTGDHIEQLIFLTMNKPFLL